ncbi:MAG: DUF1194 domain-containing protein [Rhodospirillaceae bacterium]
MRDGLLGRLLRTLTGLLGLAAAASVAGGAPAARDLAVDLELVLAVDVSGSVDEVEGKLQRDGYVQAFRHRDVVSAISGGLTRRIAAVYIEWAGHETQATLVDWRVIDSESAAIAFAREIETAPATRGRYTSISQAIRYAIPKFNGNGFEGTRRVIDISGDGANNSGGLVPVARDEAVALGITINGLPIVNDRPNRFGRQLPGLDLYYRDCVIGGPGAFMVVADDFPSFAEAIRRKLVLEISDRAPPSPPRPLLRRAQLDAPPCDSGERRLRRMFMDP